jgi:hypothetical protein
MEMEIHGSIRIVDHSHDCFPAPFHPKSWTGEDAVIPDGRAVGQVWVEPATEVSHAQLIEVYGNSRARIGIISKRFFHRGNRQWLCKGIRERRAPSRSRTWGGTSLDGVRT